MPKFQIFQYAEDSFKHIGNISDLLKNIQDCKKESVNEREGFVKILNEETDQPIDRFAINLNDDIFYLEYGIDKTTEILTIQGVQEVQYLERIPVMIFSDSGHLVIFHTIKNECESIKKLLEKNLNLNVTGNPIVPTEEKVRDIMGSEDPRATKIGHTMGADEVGGFSRNLLNTEFWRQANQGYLKSLRTNIKLSDNNIVKFGFYTDRPIIAIFDQHLFRKEQAEAIKWLINKYFSKRRALQSKL